MHVPVAEPRPSIYYDYKIYPERRPSPGLSPVVIGGAGPIGLATALDLARFGVRCVVLTEERQVSFGSRAVVLTRRSVEILQQIGVAEPFLKKGLPWTEGRSYYRGREVYRMVMPHELDDRFLPALNLQQQYMEEYLIEACLREPLIEMCWGQKIIGIAMTEDRATLRVDSVNGEYDVEASWVVAADGGRSTLRKLLELRLEGRSYSGRFVIADIKAPLNLPTERRCYFDPPWNPGSNVLLHRLPDNIWRVDLKLPDGETPEEALAQDCLSYRINAVLEMVGQPVTWELDWAAVYSANTLTLRNFNVGRVLFVGDAAHLLPIFGVRGMNTGVQEANNLAWKLAFVIRNWARPELLESYSTERVLAAREICEEAGRSTRFMVPPTDGSQLMRDAVLSFALSQDFANDLMHWRTSRPHDYSTSALNTVSASDSEFQGGVACGQPIRNVALRNGRYLFDFLEARAGIYLFAFLGDGSRDDEVCNLLAGFETLPIPLVRVLIARGPSHQSDAHVVLHDIDGRIHAKYAANAGTVYLVRPDFHVCARWRGTSCQEVQQAIERLRGGGSREVVSTFQVAEASRPGAVSAPTFEKRLTNAELEDTYDAIAAAIDSCKPEVRPLFLAKLSLALANLTGNRSEVESAIQAARLDLHGCARPK